VQGNASIVKKYEGLGLSGFLMALVEDWID
jgi:hypothetical protein